MGLSAAGPVVLLHAPMGAAHPSYAVAHRLFQLLAHDWSKTSDPIPSVFSYAFAFLMHI